MRFQHYKREKMIASHNFGVCQLKTSILSNHKGEFSKGVSLVFSGGDVFESHFPLSSDTILDFSDYLESVATGNVPSKYTVTANYKSLYMRLLYPSTLRLSFSRPEGIYIKFRLILVGATMKDIVKISSIKACAESLKTLHKYDLSKHY